MVAKTQDCPKETAEQQEVVHWADNTEYNAFNVGDFLFAIPNGGSRRKTTAHFSMEAMRMKREGVRAGVPDLMLAIPQLQFSGLFIEMKRAIKSKSRVSPEQKEWHRRLESVGYKVVVAYGAKMAIEYIKNYLRINNDESEREVLCAD